MPASPLLLHLRSSTHLIHQSLHTHPFMVEHFLGAPHPHTYALFLGCFVPSWAHIDRMLPDGLLQINSHTFEIDSPLAALLQDTQDLSHTPSHDPTPAPSCPHSSLWTLGSLYTLIGSSLGAVVLLKHLQKHLQNPPSRYMALAHTKRPWPKFTSFLHSLDLHPDHFELVAQGATETFLAIEQRFDLAHTSCMKYSMHEIQHA